MFIDYDNATLNINDIILQEQHLIYLFEFLKNHFIFCSCLFILKLILDQFLECYGTSLNCCLFVSGPGGDNDRHQF